MSVSVVKIPRGEQEYINSSWDVKQEINSKQDLLNQNKRFFHDTYLYGDSYIAVEDDMIVGFGIVIRNSYLALLGVKPNEQGRGIGKRIMKEILDDYNELTCHTRVTNDRAIDFYRELGFDIDEIERDYYKNNENAAVMKFEEQITD